MCVAACTAGVDILGMIPNPLHDSVQDWSKTSGDRDTQNKALNGAVAIPLPLPGLPSGHSGVEGSVAMFANGCTPFKGSPGFSKCKPGTQSMWSADVAAGTGNYDSTVNYDALGAGGAYAETLDSSGYAAQNEVHASNSFTGEQGDAFTRGPFPWSDPTKLGPGTALYDQGKAYADPPNTNTTIAWLDRGKLMRCPTGQAPSDIVNGLQGRRGTPGVCVGANQVGTDTSDCASAKANGFLWDQTLNGGNGGWRRPRAGSGEQPGCPNGGPPAVQTVLVPQMNVRSLIT